MPPPSCAKRATNEAPNPYPTIRSGIRSGDTAVVLLTSRYNPPTPKSDIATTRRPETPPPRKAIRRASFNELRAADAVRMLLRIEIHIPMYPGITEQPAPSRQESADHDASFTTDGTGSKL